MRITLVRKLNTMFGPIAVGAVLCVLDAYGAKLVANGYAEGEHVETGEELAEDSGSNSDGEDGDADTRDFL